MKLIDFSCKHHILLRDEDGTLRPMDEPYFRSERIADNTYQILSDGDYSYLVIGDDEAVLIDSGYGAGNIREYAASLTDRPLRNILNTHDHFDHTANNCYFECAYMSAETKPLATRPFPSFCGIDFPRDYNVKIIDEGFIYPLGGRELETFKMPDHAVGSLLFLDKKERLLFAGDEIGMPMGKPLNNSVRRFLGYMERLEKRRGEFDTICGGFGVFGADIIEKYIANLNHIMEGYEGKMVTLSEPEQAGEQDVPQAGMQSGALTSQRDALPVGPGGETVYFRRMPHFPDRPCEDPQELKFKRVMDYAGCRIIYDIRKIDRDA